ncbi:MAG: pantoate--beta-alanine ligase [Balneolaceae bacterium]|nr:MAG: pantoate--beta-alanine ligase [Balneolaceae bacterium]
MKICTSIPETRKELEKLRSDGSRIALVPTMGALHDGHLELIREAYSHADKVVVSIFVNPVQFGPNEDYETYPRETDRDSGKCRSEGVSLIFSPDASEMYSDKKLSIEIDELNRHMCGASRPGFFEGVLLVVNKLFNIVRPDVALFGQKDIQQFQLIRKMAEEFNHDIELVMVPVVRANDGLALSSRNAYLSEEERLAAPLLYRSLLYIEKQISGGVNSPKMLLSHQRSELEAKGFKIDYLNLFDLQTLQPVERLSSRQKAVIAGAAWMGKTRLIDNILIEF